MAKDSRAIEGSIRNKGRFDLDDLLTGSPPSHEDGAFFHIQFRQPKAQREGMHTERPSTYENILQNLTQDGSSSLASSLMSVIGGSRESGNDTSRPGEQKSPVGGTLSFDKFAGVQFDDFGAEVTSGFPVQSHVAPLINPSFEHLELSENLRNNDASNSTNSSTNEVKEDNVYADESLDHVHNELPITPKNSTGRRPSIILEKVASLNISTAQFENEEGKYPKRKNSIIADITKQENSLFSIDENVGNNNLGNIECASNIQSQPTISDDTIKGQIQRSFMLQNAANTVDPTTLDSQSSPDLIRSESLNAPTKERRLSTTIMGLFRGTLGESARASSFEIAQDECASNIQTQPSISDDTMKEENESSIAPARERKLSTTFMGFFRGALGESARASSFEIAQEEFASNIQTQPTISDDTVKEQNEFEDNDDNKQLERKGSFMLQNTTNSVGSTPSDSQSSGDLNLHEPSNAPARDRRLSETIIGFFRGVHESATEASIERAQEVKEIADMNMLFR